MNNEQLTEIIQTEKDALFVLAFHYCKNRCDAEDAVQNALVRLLSSKTAYESREHLHYWLVRVTINECKRLLAAPWRRRTEPLEACGASFGIAQPEESALFLEETGEISFAESYTGPQALFVLPLDSSKADSAAAAEILAKAGIA